MSWGGEETPWGWHEETPFGDEARLKRAVRHPHGNPVGSDMSPADWAGGRDWADTADTDPPGAELDTCSDTGWTVCILAWFVGLEPRLAEYWLRKMPRTAAGCCFGAGAGVEVPMPRVQKPSQAGSAWADHCYRA